jgi:hypothetical protein
LFVFLKRWNYKIYVKRIQFDFSFQFGQICTCFRLLAPTWSCSLSQGLNCNDGWDSTVNFSKDFANYRGCLKFWLYDNYTVATILNQYKEINNVINIYVRAAISKDLTSFRLLIMLLIPVINFKLHAQHVLGYVLRDMIDWYHFSQHYMYQSI